MQPSLDQRLMLDFEMALSLLQDTAPKKGLAAVARLAHGGMKETQSDPEAANNNNNNTNNNNNNNNENNNRTIGGFPGLLTPGQLFPAALMSPLALHASSLFHHSFGWTPPTPNMQVKTTSSSSSRGKSANKNKKMDVEEHTNAPLSPPTSGSSPQSTASSGQEVSIKDSREKVFTCGICNRSFGYKHVLQNHERTHTGEKPFECNECHKRFTRDHHLKTHMRLHTGEKPYHCTHCDRHFVQVANLRRHLRVHTGERPYACELCSSRFSDSNQLKAHMLIHKGEKPFQCNKCSGRFRRRHHLMHHKCHGNAKDDSEKLHDSENSVDTTSPVRSVSKSYKSEEDEEENGHADILMDHHSNINIVDDDDENDADLEVDPTEDDLNYDRSQLHFSRERKQRERKSRDIRRVVRFPNPIASIPALIPEQTEPEDLSFSRRQEDSSKLDDTILRRDDTSHRSSSPILTWPHRHPKFRRHLSPPLS